VKYEQFEEGLRSHHQQHAGQLKTELASSFDEYKTEKDEMEEEEEVKEENDESENLQPKIGEFVAADNRGDAVESEQEHAAVNVCGPEHTGENDGCSPSDVMGEKVHVDIKDEQLPAPG
jgi:hypothetical protein